jgi:hypothetical protein
MRKTEGQEYCICDFETLAEDFGMQLDPNIYVRRFAKWWAQYKPHLIRGHLPPWAQTLIANIESNGAPPTPDYVQLIAQWSEACRRYECNAPPDAHKSTRAPTDNNSCSNHKTAGRRAAPNSKAREVDPFIRSIGADVLFRTRFAQGLFDTVPRRRRVPGLVAAEQPLSTPVDPAQRLDPVASA